MKKGTHGNRLFLKVICMALTLTFGASLTAAGVMACSGCGMKCCSLSRPMPQHHTPQEQLRVSVGCCTGSPPMPCDLASATALELPEITIAFSAGHISVAAGPAGNNFGGLIDQRDFKGHVFDPSGREKFRSPPLYLQNLSFLI